MRKAMFVLSTILLVTLDVFSQGTVSLSGDVVDERGLPIYGVLVSAKTGQKTVTVITQRDGRFTIGELGPGPYDVRAVREGYAAASQQITLPNAGAVRFALKPGPFDPARLSMADMKKALPEHRFKQTLIQCQLCHSWNGLASQRPHRTANWVNGMNLMTALGWDRYEKADVPEIAQYLQSNFGPDAKLNLALEPEPIDERGLNITYMAFDIPTYHAMPHTAYPDGQGQVWFTEYGGNKIGVLDPKTGRMDEFSVPSSIRPSPHGITRDMNGVVWFTAQTAGQIGRFDPATKDFKFYTIPSPKHKVVAQEVASTEGANMRREVAPHTLIPDQRGHIWFTAGRNPLMKLDPETGEVSEYVIREGGGGLYGVTFDARTNRVWYAGLGINEVGFVDSTTGQITRFPMLTPDSGPRRLHIDSKSVAWCNLYNVSKIARIDPSTGKVTEWDLPGGRDGLPYAFGIDDKDRVWTTTYHNDQLHMFDPRTERFTSYVMPTKGNGMRDFYVDENGWMWAAAWGHNQVVAFKLNESPQDSGR